MVDAEQIDIQLKLPICQRANVANCIDEHFLGSPEPLQRRMELAFVGRLQDAVKAATQLSAL